MTLLRFFFMLLLLLLSVSPAWSREVHLWAAASLTEVMDEACRLYTLEHPEVRIVRSFASSGTLARQIRKGAPADLYLSAHPKWMTFLAENNEIEPGSTTDLAFNSLVFVARSRSLDLSLSDLPLLKRIALGSPASVPAGRYAQQALENAGLFEPLEEVNALVYARDVRQALMYVEMGAVDGAFVYKTDLRLAQKAGLQFVVSPYLYPRVRCQGALTAAGAQNEAAKDFFTYLQGPLVRQLLSNYGFDTE